MFDQSKKKKKTIFRYVIISHISDQVQNEPLSEVIVYFWALNYGATGPGMFIYNLCLLFAQKLWHSLSSLNFWPLVTVVQLMVFEEIVMGLISDGIIPSVNTDSDASSRFSSHTSRKEILASLLQPVWRSCPELGGLDILPSSMRWTSYYCHSANISGALDNRFTRDLHLHIKYVSQEGVFVDLTSKQKTYKDSCVYLYILILYSKSMCMNIFQWFSLFLLCLNCLFDLAISIANQQCLFQQEPTVCVCFIDWPQTRVVPP